MRYPIAIVPLWRWLFVLFGYSADRAYVELTAAELHLRFGTADEHIPLTEIAQIARRRWPLHYGYGAKYGPNGGVSYVGSREGVVQIDFVQPRPLNVWGPLGASQARCVTVSLEDAERFLGAARERLGRAKVA